MLRRTLVLATALAVLAAPLARPVGAATDTFPDPVSGTSPIEVLAQPAPGAATQSTVAFENRAPVPATSIDFTWLFLDANGNAIGEKHASTRGKFSTDVPIAHDRSATVYFPGRTGGASLFIGDPDTNLYDPVEDVVVTVDNATFADGSVWHGKTRQSSAPAPRMMYDPSATAAHLRIFNITPVQATSLYDHVDTRLSFANDNGKRIDAIAFRYTFYDRDGNPILQQNAVVRGAYPHGAISTFNPGSRVSFRGVVMRGGSVWMGWGPDAQYVAKIGAGVDSIEFSDGTTWTSGAD